MSLRRREAARAEHALHDGESEGETAIRALESEGEEARIGLLRLGTGPDGDERLQHFIDRIKSLALGEFGEKGEWIRVSTRIPRCVEKLWYFLVCLCFNCCSYGFFKSRF